MSADTDVTSAVPDQAPRDAASAESLTDIMDRLQRDHFERVLERRHAAVPYSVVIESFRLASAKSS
jgi:hypothetical protein